MVFLLDVSCGAFWSIAYVVAIIMGIKNRTWYIPTVSICMNFSWELLVVAHRLLSGATNTTGFYVQLIWCILDVGIILTWQLFRVREKYAYLKDLACFTCVFLPIFLFSYMMEAWTISVFLINLVMSAEFIARENVDRTSWTSRFIAVTKLLGTLAATFLNGLLIWNPFVLWLGGICFLLDSYYLVLLVKKGKG